MRRKALLILAALAALYGATPAHAKCNPIGAFDRAASKYGVDPVLLYAIALTESRGQINAVATNKNGSVDHGVMQINSIHLASLKQFGIERQALFDPCVNVEVGAWVLRQCFERHGFNWRGVGCYNSSTPHLRDAYAAKVAKRYEQLLTSSRKRSTMPSPHLESTPLARSVLPTPTSSAMRCNSPSGCVVYQQGGGRLLVLAHDNARGGLLAN